MGLQAPVRSVRRKCASADQRAVGLRAQAGLAHGTAQGTAVPGPPPLPRDVGKPLHFPKPPFAYLEQGTSPTLGSVGRVA